MNAHSTCLDFPLETKKIIVAVVLSKGSRPRTEISFWITTSLSTVEMTSLIPQRKKRALLLQQSEVTTVITKKIT